MDVQPVSGRRKCAPEGLPNALDAVAHAVQTLVSILIAEIEAARELGLQGRLDELERELERQASEPDRLACGA
jgi:hypothetical protein